MIVGLSQHQKMSQKFPVLPLNLAWLLMSIILSPVASHPDIRIGSIKCTERERNALLQFKQGLADDCGLLANWDSHEVHQRDCCQWTGIGCSNLTGHVVSLDLRAPCDGYNDCKRIRGNISPSLVALEELNHLDLSGNDFGGNSIPGFIGSFIKLRYLNLSNAALSGKIPRQFKNLPSLQSLDLSHNSLLSAENLNWLSPLSLLQTLSLNGVELTSATDWVRVVTSLPSLAYMSLDDCSLPNKIPPSLSHVNSTKSLAYIHLSNNRLLASSLYQWLFNYSSLFEIDLSLNKLQGPIPEAFGNMSHLTWLDLSGNQLEGVIPNSFGHLCCLQALAISRNKLSGQLDISFKGMENSLRILRLDSNSLSGSLPDFTRFLALQELDLSHNQLNGSLPFTFREHSSLEILDLSDNQLMGSLPELSLFPSLRKLHLQMNQFSGNISKGLGQLLNLEKLDLFSNFLEGAISEAHLANLPKLRYLDLSHNMLAFDVSLNWTPPFRLDVIVLDTCNLGPQFPKWLQTQSNYSYLSISDTGISDSLPEWFWNLSPNARYICLSQNEIHGLLPDSSVQYAVLPSIDLSFNSLEGSVPLFLRNVSSLDLSNNNLSGSISLWCPTSSTRLLFLDLSNNNLSGELPNCWMRMGPLSVLNLENNHFVGKISDSFGDISRLRVLNLGNNKLSGELPSSLKNLTSLQILDVSANSLSGEVPEWVGSSLLQLKFLILRQNKFSGSITLNLCNLFHILVLDLSLNNISGTIPKCLYNLKDLSKKADLSTRYGYVSIFNWMNIYASLVWKGVEREYWKNLALVRSIDLSSNKLNGAIPAGISYLSQLQSLNLSRNHLTGPITPELGQLINLESLDLSRNQLSGKIPIGLSNLNFLGTLDLSYNNLSGKIPTGTQLDGFTASSYMGNPELCGSPVESQCAGDGNPFSDQHKGETERDDLDAQSLGLHISIWLGFSTGFWGLCGILLFKRSWRCAYFRFWGHMYDKVHVTVAMKVAHLKRWFRA